MNKLAPSILAADFTRLGDEIDLVVNAGADYIHIDVMDGLFVPNIAFGVPAIQSLRKSTNAFFDVHLMIHEPIRYIEAFANAGADLISFHLEAVSDVPRVILAIKSCGKKVGIAINPTTLVDELIPYLENVDMILIMSVEPGFGGQCFMESSINKVKRLVELRKNLGLVFEIEIDGGISFDNIDKTVEAGVNVFVVGSSIFGMINIGATTKAYKDRLLSSSMSK